MRLAVSNIAWTPDEADRAIRLLSELGVPGLEIAPTMLWPDWEGASRVNAEEYRRALNDSGLICSSLQAVLYGRPDLQLFGDDQQKRDLADHLTMVAELARSLGAGVVVLGAPKNRRRGELPADAAFETAVKFFSDVGGFYEERGVTLCIEPNPPEYDCDFITDAEEGIRLVKAVGSSGFGLHLDAGALILAHDDGSGITKGASVLRHFHISQPSLSGFGSPRPEHHDLAHSLFDIGFSGWRSIEMRRPGRGLEHVREAVTFARGTYLQHEDGN
ncbi:MAG: sugar phosphate isomerase/epimerase family protein [Actinomycetota bacterium]